MMVGFIMLIATALLSNVLAEDLMEYDSCMAACEEKFAGDTDNDQFEVCKDSCNEDQKDRCVAADPQAEETCLKAGEQRCKDRCEEDSDGCPLLCEALFSKDDE
ncbi:hypothetical protein CRM22_001541 [Opisthorchis felineus]|uniref:4Fe-4S ferredoxin-type domain-containing protein n=1 Tax=Opisthorchis felineus TaxID=147828 RepID=A0A4S2MA74_OPIFE|nr:hypothetical protein CRM22_001541 [Opisthorchis felineus]